MPAPVLAEMKATVAVPPGSSVGDFFPRDCDAGNDQTEEGEG
jgi:hypothetical protein